jgi:catechol 2,3-dioxygenase-like lactoylglutathione lyase family enzyme
MILGIQDVYYNVQDMDKAIYFYTTALGLVLRQKDPWWSSLDCGGVTLGLHWSENQPVPAVPKDNHGAFAGATLTLKSNDIQNDRLKLENCGATILSESKQTWGHMLVFLDPDGNVLKLMSPAAG